MENKNNILIVCFSFPPFPGIGGRRWAKFAKHLAKNNFNVHVLAAENNLSEVSEWTSETQHENIILHTVPLGFSKVFSFYPKTLFEKIVYKILSFIGSLQIKGNKQDKVFFIRKKMLLLAEQIIKEQNISTIIITIPPYKLSYYLLPLKKKFTNLKFIVDYRDPWTDNKSYHGFANINEIDLTKEIEFEKQVLATADVVFDVNTYSLELLKVKTKSNAKFVHLPNGYDLEDYKFVIPKDNNSNKKRFIYSGSFYPNLIYLLEPLITCLKKIEKSHPDLYKTLSFDFYGNMDHNAVSLLKKSGCMAIKFHGNLSQKKVFDELNNADFTMLFSANDHQHTFNTKFYEYLYFKKPILYFGKRGETSDFVLNKKVGLAFTSENLTDSFYQFLISDQLKDFRYNESFDIKDFEVSVIAKKLIEIIHE